MADPGEDRAERDAGAVGDRIRHTKDTGIRNLPRQGFNQNLIRFAIVALASSCSHGPDSSPIPPTMPAGGNPNGL